MQNSFDALSDEMDLENEQAESNNESKIEVQDSEKRIRIPPVVIYANIQNHNETFKELRKNLNEDFSLKCKIDIIIIYTRNMADYKKVSDKMSAAQVPYHTYTPDNEKPVTSILKGLATNVSESEVKADLIDKNIKVLEVKQFVKKWLTMAKIVTL